MTLASKWNTELVPELIQEPGTTTTGRGNLYAREAQQQTQAQERLKEEKRIGLLGNHGHHDKHKRRPVSNQLPPGAR